MCDCSHQIGYTERPYVVSVRGEKVEVPAVRVPRCSRCGEEVWSDEDGDALLLNAYRLYRDRKDLLQPEEIRVRRSQCGLSQEELDQELGWSPGTVAAYEDGTLQTREHDAALRLKFDASALAYSDIVCMPVDATPASMPWTRVMA